MDGARRSHRDENPKHLDLHLSDDSSKTLFEEYLLRRAARACAESQRQVAEAVSLSLSGGLSWDRIGQLLGISVQEAQVKYGGIARRAS